MYTFSLSLITRAFLTRSSLKKLTRKTREIKVFHICYGKKTREINTTCLIDCHCDHKIGYNYGDKNKKQNVQGLK